MKHCSRSERTRQTEVYWLQRVGSERGDRSRVAVVGNSHSEMVNCSFPSRNFVSGCDMSGLKYLTLRLEPLHRLLHKHRIYWKFQHRTWL